MVVNEDKIFRGKWNFCLAYNTLHYVQYKKCNIIRVKELVQLPLHVQLCCLFLRQNMVFLKKNLTTIFKQW